MARDRTSARGRSPGFTRAKLEISFLLRMGVLACVAVAGSAWGLVRYYTHARLSMLAPPPPPRPPSPEAGVSDAGVDLIPIELEPR